MRKKKDTKPVIGYIVGLVSISAICTIVSLIVVLMKDIHDRTLLMFLNDDAAILRALAGRGYSYTDI